MCLSGESSQEDIQYRNTVWDMFQQETKYLTNLLQPLELVSVCVCVCVYVRARVCVSLCMATIVIVCMIMQQL